MQSGRRRFCRPEGTVINPMNKRTRDRCGHLLTRDCLLTSIWYAVPVRISRQENIILEDLDSAREIASAPLPARLHRRWSAVPPTTAAAENAPLRQLYAATLAAFAMHSCASVDLHGRPMSPSPSRSGSTDECPSIFGGSGGTEAIGCCAPEAFPNSWLRAV